MATYGIVVSVPRHKTFADGLEDIFSKDVGQVDIKVLGVLDSGGENVHHGGNTQVGMGIKRGRYFCEEGDFGNH